MESQEPKHNHNAAVEGHKGEAIFRSIVKECGLTLLKTAAEFEEAGVNPWGKVWFHAPEEWAKPIVGRPYKKFITDGWILELDLVVDIKYGTKDGTAEQKIYFDIKRIEDGVYEGKKYIFVFLGPLAFKKDASLFAQVVEEKNLPVTVLQGKNAVKEYLLLQKKLVLGE